MYVPLFADIIAAERWLMIMPMAVGTSVCAALVVAAQMQNNSFSHEQKTAAGSTHGFIFLLILAAVCLILQIVGFKNYEKREKQ